MLTRAACSRPSLPSSPSPLRLFTLTLAHILALTAPGAPETTSRADQTVDETAEAAQVDASEVLRDPALLAAVVAVLENHIQPSRACR